MYIVDTILRFGLTLSMPIWGLGFEIALKNLGRNLLLLASSEFFDADLLVWWIFADFSMWGINHKHVKLTFQCWVDAKRVIIMMGLPRFFMRRITPKHVNLRFQCWSVLGIRFTDVWWMDMSCLLLCNVREFCLWHVDIFVLTWWKSDKYLIVWLKEIKTPERFI